MPGRTIRHWWVTAHRWLGLGLGILVAFLGLTGSLLVYWFEIDRALDSETFTGAVAGPASPETIVNAVRLAHPGLGAPLSISFVQGLADYPAVVTMDGPGGPVEVTVSPGTGDVLGRRDQSRSLMWWVFDLHASLGLSRAEMPGHGHLLVGLLGIAMLLSLSTGLAVWWPRNRRFRVALTMKRRSSRHRFTMDLHRVGGIYGLLVLFLLAVTGVYLAKPGWVTPLISPLGPLARESPVPSPADPPCAGRLSADQALAAARTVRPTAALARFNFPGAPDQPYTVAFYRPGSPRQTYGGSDFVFIDPTCGSVLGVRAPVTAGDTIVDWMLPLHSGEAFGPAGRAIVCIAGLIPTVLLVTGLVVWRRKSRGRRRAFPQPEESRPSASRSARASVSPKASSRGSIHCL